MLLFLLGKDSPEMWSNCLKYGIFFPYTLLPWKNQCLLTESRPILSAVDTFLQGEPCRRWVPLSIGWRDGQRCSDSGNRPIRKETNSSYLLSCLLWSTPGRLSRETTHLQLYPNTFCYFFQERSTKRFKMLLVVRDPNIFLPLWRHWNIICIYLF